MTSQSESIRAALTALVEQWREKAAVFRDRANNYTDVGEDARARVSDRAWLEVSKCADDLSALLERLLGTPQSEWSVEKAARTVLETFERDEAQGYRSRDRQFAIRLLKAALTEPPPPQDDESRCAVCGWPLVEQGGRGCWRGNCSMRPLPERFYAPERAVRECPALAGRLTEAPASPQSPDPNSSLKNAMGLSGNIIVLPKPAPGEEP